MAEVLLPELAALCGRRDMEDRVVNDSATDVRVDGCVGFPRERTLVRPGHRWTVRGVTPDDPGFACWVSVVVSGRRVERCLRMPTSDTWEDYPVSEGTLDRAACASSRASRGDVGRLARRSEATAMSCRPRNVLLRCRAGFRVESVVRTARRTSLGGIQGRGRRVFLNLERQTARLPTLNLEAAWLRRSPGLLEPRG